MNTNNLDFLVECIKVEIENFAEIINYKGSLRHTRKFEKALYEHNNYINEYIFGRLYGFAEIYFDLTKEVNPYEKLVEIIGNYDLEFNK